MFIDSKWGPWLSFSLFPNPCAKIVYSTNIVMHSVLTSLKGFTAHVYLTGNRKSMSNTLCLALPLQPVSCTLGEKLDFFTTPPDWVLDPGTQMSIWLNDCYSLCVHDPLSQSEKGGAAKVLLYFFSSCAFSSLHLRMQWWLWQRCSGEWNRWHFLIVLASWLFFFQCFFGCFVAQGCISNMHLNIVFLMTKISISWLIYYSVLEFSLHFVFHFK